MTEYPPPRHVLRDLPFELEDVGPDAARAHLAVDPSLCRDGRLDVGPLLVVTDVLAGLLVGRVLAPDWMATAQLSMHLVEPPAAGGAVVIDAVVRRAGRTTIVMEARLRSTSEGTESDVGEALLTFVRLPRRDGNLDIADTPLRYGERFRIAERSGPEPGPFRDEVGVVVVDAATGAVTVEVAPYVHNSFGAVNGGVVGATVAAAAEAAAGARIGAPVRPLDVAVHYLSQARVGPVRTTASVLRIDGGVALVRVEAYDDGLPDGDGADGDGPRLVVIAHVHCVAT